MEELRVIMHDSIDKYGLNSDETLRASVELDRMILLMQKEIYAKHITKLKMKEENSNIR